MISSVQNFSVRILYADRFMIVIFQILDIKSNYLPGIVHAGEQFTRCSRTGFVIYLNMAPIVWFSKPYTTVESSVFGAEFVAMNNGI
jgi:hypothetical protein